MFVLFVNVLILTINAEAFKIPFSRKIDGDYNNSYYRNCITTCNENHKNCSDFCMKLAKMIINQSIRIYFTSFQLINGRRFPTKTSTPTCAPGKILDRNGCHKVHSQKNKTKI